MKKFRIYALVAFTALTLFSIPNAFAQHHTAAQKFGRGLVGMTCGFLEIPGNIVKETYLILKDTTIIDTEYFVK